MPSALEEKGADNRIAQYETNYRVPKRELLDKMAEALRVDRQNFYTIAPGSAEDFMRTFFMAGRGQPWRYPPVPTCPAIRAEQGPPMIPLYGTMIATTGLFILPWGCTSSTDLWTSSCGNGYFASRSLHAGEITREEYFEWKLNWPHICDDGWKANIISLGGKINKTSKTALLNLSFSRAVLLVLLGLFFEEYRADTNSINPVSRAVWTGKSLYSRGFPPFLSGHSHSLVAGV